MEANQYQNILKELKIIRKLLVANLYANNVSSEDLSKITGMGESDIRGLISKRKTRGRSNAKEKEID